MLKLTTIIPFAILNKCLWNINVHIFYAADTFGLKPKQSNNSIDASQSASSTTSHSGSNSSRNNQSKNNRNKGNSGSLSPPNQLPPPPPITSSTGSSQSKFISKDES